MTGSRPGPACRRNNASAAPIPSARPDCSVAASSANRNTLVPSPGSTFSSARIGFIASVLDREEHVADVLVRVGAETRMRIFPPAARARAGDAEVVLAQHRFGIRLVDEAVEIG